MSGQGRPSRYTRSFGGMTGALIVTVLFVVAFVSWRGLFRTDTDDTPIPVDWQASVELADEVGSSRVDLQACKLEYSIVSPK